MNQELRVIASQWIDASTKLRDGCVGYLKEVLKRNNNALNWRDKDLPEYVSVVYNGFTDPVFSNVYGITLNEDVDSTDIDFIYLDIEHCSKYSIIGIATEELYDICIFIDAYAKEIGVK